MPQKSSNLPPQANEAEVALYEEAMKHIPQGYKPELYLIRHSAAHVMAQAVRERFSPKGPVRIAIGPPIENGFYYDFDLPCPPTEEDLAWVESRMKEIVRGNHPFRVREVTAAEARELFQGEPYKLELIDGLTAGSVDENGNTIAKAQMTKITVYQHDTFVDLCRGPHVRHTGEIVPDALKLLQISGAYWRGDEKRPMLQRIYGTAWQSKEELDHYLWQRAEAEKRDHRRLGKELELFTFSDDVGKGLPLWLPNGTVLREELEKLAKEEEHKEGYVRVATPHITKENLYFRSGHLPYYKDDMYAPIKIEEENYYLKPMNCPHHHQIYLSRPRSYRELPLRLAEYGQVYRFEQSGVLSGLMRVRGFAQNDAHIYCRYDQAKNEFVKVMRLHARYYDLMGIEDYFMRFSKPDLTKLDKYVNEPEKWLSAMQIIQQAMDESGYPYVEAAGEAAFYGPKIDFMIKSAIGNEYAISTNQLDFLASSRFELTYTGEDNQLHPVYVIHRAPLGSHERFVAFLIEHYAGVFPTWLAPLQAIVIPIADRHQDYARQVYQRLFSADVPTVTGGVRVEMDDSRETMQKKIYNADKLRKIPYMLIVGDREAQNATVSVRLRGGIDLKAMPIDTLIERIRTEVGQRQDSKV